MKPERADNILRKFPILFSTFLTRGDKAKYQFCVGDGWYYIVDNICKGIYHLIGDKDVNVDVLQIKEKFGGLRFYYTITDIADRSTFEIIVEKVDWWIRGFMCKHGMAKTYWKLYKIRTKYYKTIYEKIREIVDEGELLSYRTCEICSAEGDTRSINHYLVTLCDEHAKIETERKMK